MTKDGTEREDKAREFARFRVCGLDAALAADSDEEQKFAWQQFVSSSKTARETTEADFEKAQARAAEALKALDGAMAATVADAIHEMAVAFRRLFAVQEVMEHRVSSFAKVGLAAKVVGHNWHRKTSDPKVTESRLAEYRELLQRFYADNPRAKWQAAVAHVAGPGADSRKVEAARKFLERQKVRASDFKPLA